MYKSSPPHRKYIECSSGVGTARKCPMGHSFDRVRRVCEWSVLVTCRLTTPAAAAETTTTSSSSTSSSTSGAASSSSSSSASSDDEEVTFVRPQAEGAFPLEDGNCEKYYSCSENVASVRRCPQGQLGTLPSRLVGHVALKVSYPQHEFGTLPSRLVGHVALKVSCLQGKLPSRSVGNVTLKVSWSRGSQGELFSR